MSSKMLNPSGTPVAYRPSQYQKPTVNEQPDDSDPKVAEFQAATKNDGYTQPKYSETGTWKDRVADPNGPPVTQNDDSNFAPNAGDSEEGDEEMDDIVITKEEEAERAKFLQQGADMSQRRNFNKVRSLPPKAAEIIVNASWAFRAAWEKGKHPILVNVIRQANVALSKLDIPANLIEEFKNCSNYVANRGNPREDYVASISLQETFIDTILQLAQYAVEWDKEEPGEKKSEMSMNLATALMGTQETIYNMGLSYILVTPHWLIEDLGKLFQDAITFMKQGDEDSVRTAESIQAWLAGDIGRQPTVAQVDSAVRAPYLIKQCFDGLAKGVNPESSIEDLEFIEQEVATSNNRVGLKRNDHTDLGSEKIKQAFLAIQAGTTEKEKKNNLKKEAFHFCMHMYSLGWGCLLDEIPELLDAKGQERFISSRSLYGNTGPSFVGKALIDKQIDDTRWLTLEKQLMNEGTKFQNNSATIPGSVSTEEEDDDDIYGDALKKYAQEPNATKPPNHANINSNSSSQPVGSDTQGGSASTLASEPTSIFGSKLKRPGGFTQQGFHPTAAPGVNTDKPPFQQYKNPLSNVGENAGKSDGGTFQFGAGKSSTPASGRPFKTPNFSGPSVPKPADSSPSSFPSATKAPTTGGPSVAAGVPPMFKNCTMPGPVGADSQKTELGWIVGGRKCGGLSSRHVVNVGTTINPVYKVIDGPTFGRGLGPALVEKYPLPTPKLPYESTERLASDIKQVRHVAISAPSANSDRRPVTYYCIRWKSDTQDYWLSRSELISFVGKAWLDRKDRSTNMPSRHDQMENAMESNLKCLQHCKANNLHPDTGKPLVESDRNDTPWLFPTSY